MPILTIRSDPVRRCRIGALISVREHVGVSRRQLTPQEKKKLSLERDRIDIAWNDRHGQRSGRHGERPVLSGPTGTRFVCFSDWTQNVSQGPFDASRFRGNLVQPSRKHLEDRASRRETRFKNIPGSRRKPDNVGPGGVLGRGRLAAAATAPRPPGWCVDP